MVRFLLARLWLLVVAAAAPSSSGVVLPPPARRARDNAPSSRTLQEQQQQQQQVSTTAEHALRQQLLTSYDRASFPFTSFWESHGNRTGLPVELGLNFHRVLMVDPTSSVVDMIVW